MARKKTTDSAHRAGSVVARRRTRHPGILVVAVSIVLGACPAQQEPPLESRGAAFCINGGRAKLELEDEANIHAVFARFLASATKTVDIAMYRLDLEQVVEALLSAANRGVRVRVVTDDDSVHHRFKKAFDRLLEAKIEVATDSKNPFDWAVHHKFAVVDSHRVWTGDWNANRADTVNAHHAALWIASRDMASRFSAEFERLLAGPDWGSLTVAAGPATPRWSEIEGGGRGDVHFGNSENLVSVACRVIGEARREIIVGHTEFTAWPVADALARAALRGVRVRVLHSYTSRTMRYVQAGLRFGCDVRQMPRGPHFIGWKFILIDGRTVATGSWNMLNYTPNCENLLVLEDAPDLVSRYRAEFERVWRIASPFWLGPDSEDLLPTDRERRDIIDAITEGKSEVPSPKGPPDAVEIPVITEFEQPGLLLRPVGVAGTPYAVVERIQQLNLVLEPASDPPRYRRQRIVFYSAVLASSAGPFIDPRIEPIELDWEHVQRLKGRISVPYTFTFPINAVYKFEIDVFAIDEQGGIEKWLATYKVPANVKIR